MKGLCLLFLPSSLCRKKQGTVKKQSHFLTLQQFPEALGERLHRASTFPVVTGESQGALLTWRQREELSVSMETGYINHFRACIFQDNSYVHLFAFRRFLSQMSIIIGVVISPFIQHSVDHGADCWNVQIWSSGESPRSDPLMKNLHSCFERQLLASWPPNCAEIRTIQSSWEPLKSSAVSFQREGCNHKVSWGGHLTIKKDAIIANRSSWKKLTFTPLQKKEGKGI